jgi:hypothetical protein
VAELDAGVDGVVDFLGELAERALGKTGIV